jgi:hypothetical protein
VRYPSTAYQSNLKNTMLSLMQPDETSSDRFGHTNNYCHVNRNTDAEVAAPARTGTAVSIRPGSGHSRPTGRNVNAWQGKLLASR